MQGTQQTKIVAIFIKLFRINYIRFFIQKATEITYTPGTYVYPKGFSETPDACAEGIHFFATIAETLDFLIDRWTFKRGYYEGYQIVRLKVDFKDIAPLSLFNNYVGKCGQGQFMLIALFQGKNIENIISFFKTHN